MNDEIRNLESSLLREEVFEEYEKYENLLDRKGRLETDLRRIENEYGKLNAGKVRWNIAYALERMEQFAESIRYYRTAISFDFDANMARKKSLI
ncbi:MAG: hypothetical protein E4G96_09920 [Chrysiogenales bacterium]|nr:MAG: hypothetical protein E4G96_09920 [Chrysiogenales bacterium]